MTKVTSLIIGALLILGAVGLVYWQKQSISIPVQTADFGSAGKDYAALVPPPEVTNNSPSAQMPTSPTPPAQAPAQTGSTDARSPQASGYTAADVARHASRSSCWSAINGSVYDLTSWIPQHPGGEGSILKLCGTDGSTAFNRQHGGAAKQAAILAGFKIGTLQ